MWHWLKQTSHRSERGHTLSAALFLVQSPTPLTPYTELHNLPVCLHFSSGQMLLRKKKAAITAKHCRITHGDTAVSEFGFIDLSMKDGSNVAELPEQTLQLNRGQIVHSCLFFVNIHKQAHKVKRKQSFSAAEVVQNCWSALLVAELHKGGVISFRITQRKSNMGWLCANWFFRMETWTFIVCGKKKQKKTKPTSQDNDFHSTLGDIFTTLWALSVSVNVLEKKKVI